MMKKNNKGFTIVELVIVILVIATLVAIIVPNFMGQVENAEIATTKANLENIRSAARLYFAEQNRHWPVKIQNLIDSGYLRVFPEEALTPIKKEKNSGGVDNTGGWYYEYRGDTQVPIINLNKIGVDKFGQDFSTY